MSQLEEMVREAESLNVEEMKYILAIMRGMNFTRDVIKKENEEKTA